MKRLRLTSALLGGSLLLAGCGSVPAAPPNATVKAAVSSELKLTFSNVRFNAAAADIYGNLYVGGKKNGLGLLQKFSPSGKILWTEDSLSGSTLHGDVKRVATDRSGNVYILAQLYASDDAYDFLAKYAPDGTQLWNIGEDGKNDFAVDAAGNVYTIYGFTNDDDVKMTVVTKISTDGAVLWTKTIKETYLGSAPRIGVSLSGTIYTNRDIGGKTVLTQYRTDGAEGFKKTFDGYALRGVVVSPAGSAFTLRHSVYSLARPGDALNKYNVSGTWQWARSLPKSNPNPPYGDWYASAIAISDAAKLYIGGRDEFEFNTSSNAYLEKRDPDSGNLIWNAAITCPTTTFCTTNGVAVGALGKVWAVGTYEATETEGGGSFIARFAQ